MPLGTPPSYRPARATDLLHMRLEVAFDFQKHRVFGVETLTFTALAGGTDRLLLDTEDCTIRSVRELASHVPNVISRGSQKGSALPFSVANKTLSVTLPRRLSPGRKMTVEIAYDGVSKRGQGLHFVGPYAGYPQRLMVWSQGEPDDNHRWFPTWDQPDDKFSSEMIVTVPAAMTAVSNGRLLRVSNDGFAGSRNTMKAGATGAAATSATTAPNAPAVSLSPPAGPTRTFHWRQDKPHSTYLVSVVAGEMAHVQERAGKLPLSYYVPVGREDDVRRTFAETPKMIATFERLLGVAYPWDKYAQIACWEYGGGMENTSATILGTGNLVQRGEEADREATGLVAHELAHQWFGDLVTCRDWGEIWLNESFATYFDMLYTRDSRGEDAYAMQLRGARQSYLREVARVRRPVATPLYPSKWAMFGSGTTYSKGGYLLHTLRERMGDEAFFGGLRLYLTRNAYQPVETADLRRALEEYSGQSLGDWFDQWILRPGHAELKVDWKWDEKAGVAQVSVAQTQNTSDGTPLYRQPLQLLFRAGGQMLTREVNVTRGSETFSVALPAAPEMLLVDPRHRWMMTLDMARAPEAWMAQLRHGPDAWSRVDAAQALSRLIGNETAGGFVPRALPPGASPRALPLGAPPPGPARRAFRAGMRAAQNAEASRTPASPASPEPPASAERATVRAALRESLSRDPARWVRVEAARALAPAAAAADRDALVAAWRETGPRGRADMVEALADVPAALSPVPLLHEIMTGDISRRARGIALRALARRGGDERAAALRQARLLVADNADAPPSLRLTALQVLAEWNPADALPVAMRWAGPGASLETRGGALALLETLGRGDATVRDLLLSAAAPDSPVRAAAANALVQRSEPESAAALEAQAKAAADPEQREFLTGAAGRIRQAIERRQREVDAARERLQQAEQEAAAARRRLQELEPGAGQ